MVKQVIVINKSLNMRKGKIAAQAAHASMAVLLEMMRGGKTYQEWQKDMEAYGEDYSLTLNVAWGSSLDEWLRGAFTKICVSVNSEAELDALFQAAKEQNLPVSMITDNGWTEFHGVPTKTCIAIGPAPAEEIDKITGGLSLL